MRNNESQHTFELDVEGKTVFANYRLDQDVLYINYVEAPESLRGTGAAGRLMEDIMNEAKEKNYKIVPICAYAVSWIKRHPEYQALLK